MTTWRSSRRGATPTSFAANDVMRLLSSTTRSRSVFRDVTWRAMSPSAAVLICCRPSEISRNLPATPSAMLTARSSLSARSGRLDASINAVSNPVTRAVREPGSSGVPKRASIRCMAVAIPPSRVCSAVASRLSASRAGSTAREIPSILTPPVVPGRDEVTSVLVAYPSVAALAILEATTSAEREAAVNPLRAFDNAPAMLMFVLSARCVIGCVSPQDQRLMLVVSCSISSTVWMTLAFEE